jgi:hypothetical protein
MHKIIKRVILFILFLSSITIFQSCTKESTSNNSNTNTQTDPRDFSVGTFKGTQIVTLNNGNPMPSEVSVLVSKGSGNTIIMNFGGGMILNSSDITTKTTGYIGSIPTQNVTLSGGVASVTGNGLPGAHFEFNSDKKTMGCSFKSTQPGTIIGVIFSGNKQ